MNKKLFSIVLFLFSVTIAFANSTPVLSNFRVEDSEKSRVYFDSSLPLSGSSATTNGFFITGKSVSSITLNAGQTTGHYLTVSAAFDYWDNNTIRYEGSSNIGIHNFTLQHIKNNIVEPSSSVIRYASVNGAGNHDGTSEANAWTLKEAQSNSAPGMTIYVKAGDYGNEQLLLSGKGATASTPIKFIGYKSTPGDITNYYYKYGVNTVLDVTEMPTLDNTSRNGLQGMVRIRTDFVIIRNFQATEGAFNFIISGPRQGVVFDNCISKNTINTTSGFDFTSGGTRRSRITNSLSLNAEMAGIHAAGDYSLISNCEVYSDELSGGPASDYYIFVDGSYNIVRDSYAERVVNDTHGGHGIGLKSDIVDNEVAHNLFESCTVVGSDVGMELRHKEVMYNVVRDLTILPGNIPLSSPWAPSGIIIRDDASYNTIENSLFKGLEKGIGFRDNSEQGVQPSGRNNVIVNCVFENLIHGVSAVNGTDARVIGNKIINSTFHNIDILYSDGGNRMTGNNNEMINCIISDVNERFDGWGSNPQQSRGFRETFCAYNGNGYNSPTGAGNVNANPMFVNANAGNFKLLENSPIKDSGSNRSEVNYDKDGTERYDNKYSIGAYEDTAPRVGSVSPTSATICEGESITLVASGGTSYNWNTGDTTETITVSPTTTTTYNVTISDGTNSDSHDIEVTVNATPTADAGADETICEGESVTLTATGNGDFLWNTGETTASITVSPTTTTTYSVTASNSCSSTATDDVTVTVNPGVTADAGSDQIICEGESVTLTATGTGPFTWNTGETTASITVNPLNTTTYTVSATNGSCSTSDDVTVTVNTPPTVNAGADQTICEGETVTLTATGNGDFLWSTGETTASITVSPTSTITYSVTASNSCSTTATDDVVVTVNPGVTADAGSDVSICEGESVTLTATGTGPFTWNTGETTASITVNPTNTTTYTVSAANGSCSVSDDVIVTVNTPPTVNAGADQTICEGETVTLTATGNGDFLWSTGETTASITVSPTSTITYSVTTSNSCSTTATDDVTVTVNPGVTADAGSDISICQGEVVTLTATGTGPFAWSTGETTASITVNPANTTTYTVSATNGNCSVSDDVIVTVNTSPTVNAGADQTICEGESITLTATGSGDFLWSTGETTASITVNPATTTTYSVTATSQGCQSTAVDYVEVIVGESPNLSTTDNVTIQEGETVTLNATGNGAFRWSTGETTSSITVSPSATTNYTVTLTANGGCSEKKTITVTVNESSDGGQIVAYAGEDITICSGNEIVLTASGGDNYLWSTGETEQSIKVNPNESTVYSVLVSKEGYSDTAYVKVTVDGSCASLEKEMIVYPNPTEGLVNIDLVGYEKNTEIQLYNLNGVMVYSYGLKNDQSVTQINHKINLSSFTKGIYLLRLFNNGQAQTKKIIVH